MGCGVVIHHVTLSADAETRVAHAAAYRAFAAASLLCEWTLSALFPEVAMIPGERIDVAQRRVVQAFTSAGCSVSAPQRKVPPSLDDAVSAFSLYTGVEGGSRRTHLFFVCPQPWTPQRVQDFRKYVRDAGYDYFHDGELSEVHVLAAYPLDPE
jgi:hypothetical protein